MRMCLICGETLLGVRCSQRSCQGIGNGIVRNTVHKKSHSSSLAAEVTSKRFKILEGREAVKIVDDLIR